MAAKRKYLTDEEIQTVVCLSPKQRDERLDSMGQTVEREFTLRLLVTAHIVSRIAVAAWDVARATATELPSRLKQLNTVMHDYSPGNFPRHAGELEVVVDELRVLSEDMESLSADECRELTKGRLTEYEKELDRQRGTKPPRTPA
jgi:hypothetical protein